MMDTSTATMLTRYNAWADDALFKAISRLPPETVYRKTDTLFGSMLGTLNHNYQVDLIWRANLVGERHGFISRRELLHPGMDELVKAQATINQWFIDWASSQSRSDFEETVMFQFVSGKHARMSKGNILLHVINHKTYHRGWVAEMFFDSGTKPPETDLCIFLDEQPAGADQVAASRSM
jgi:uncharacterized damage-inducible protein DinB